MKKKKYTYILDIPTPCHEKWNEMTPNERGRFCSSCSKTVIDFTKMSDKEVINFIKNGISVCGKFNNHQLNRTITDSSNAYLHTFFPLPQVIFGFFILSSPTPAFSQTDTSKIEIHSLKGDVNSNLFYNRTQVNTIEGRLLDSVTLEPVVTTKVELKTINDEWITHTYSDSDGKFKIEIPKNIDEDYLIITIHPYFDHQIKKVIIDTKNDTIGRRDILLSPTEIEITMGIVVITDKKETRKKRKNRKKNS